MHKAKWPDCSIVRRTTVQCVGAQVFTESVFWKASEQHVVQVISESVCGCQDGAVAEGSLGKWVDWVSQAKLRLGDQIWEDEVEKVMNCGAPVSDNVLWQTDCILMNVCLAGQCAVAQLEKTFCPLWVFVGSAVVGQM